VAGEGTVIENLRGGEFLVSAVEGFLSIDPGTKRISIGPKIISREGVSARTTGNLQLTGEYEEFGDVQEQRLSKAATSPSTATCSAIINSRGGDIVLSPQPDGRQRHQRRRRHPRAGRGVGRRAADEKGRGVLARAESCIISGTQGGDRRGEQLRHHGRRSGHQGGRGLRHRRAQDRDQPAPVRASRTRCCCIRWCRTPPGSTRSSPSCSPRWQHAQREANLRKAEIDAITGQTEVRNYLTLATRVRKREITLTPEQEPLFHKMAAAVGPSLKAVAKISLAMKAAQVQQEQAQEEVDQVQRQKKAVMRGSSCVGADADRRHAAAHDDVCAGGSGGARSSAERGQDQGAHHGRRHDDDLLRPHRRDQLGAAVE
jgi:hypothetical protein